MPDSRRWVELLVLFAVFPALLLLPVPPLLIAVVVLAAVAYCIVLTRREKLATRPELLTMDWRFLKRGPLQRFALFVLLSTLLMAWLLPQQLFIVVRENPVLWAAISVFYVVFSVYPQEFIYRQFFFRRYHMLVPDKRLFMVLNALLFCFAHLVFLNTLVFALTFVGGLLFAATFEKSRSLMTTSLEHSLYGLWLYALGMGNMLAFPGP